MWTEPAKMAPAHCELSRARARSCDCGGPVERAHTYTPVTSRACERVRVAVVQSNLGRGEHSAQSRESPPQLSGAIPFYRLISTHNNMYMYMYMYNMFQRRILSDVRAAK